MRRFLDAAGAFLRVFLRGLFALARGAQGVDRAFVARAGHGVLVLGNALAQALARAHRGTVQDMTLLYLAGLALLLVGRLFGS